MRKIVFLSFLSLLFLPFLTFAKDKSETHEIVIIKQKKEKEPRTPDYGSDIAAYYQDGAIYLQFAYDMGEVEITVTNETTGEMWQQTEDSAFGSTSIATSTDAGNYYITIVTDDASCYSGNFSL